MGPTSVRTLQFLIVAVALNLGMVFSAMERVSAQSPAPVATDQIRIEVSSAGAIDGATLESTVRPVINVAVDELASLFGLQPQFPLVIRFGAIPDQAIMRRWQSVDSVAWIDPGRGLANVDLDRFSRLSPVEADNVIRNLTARLTLFEASSGTIPAGLVDGIASYFERPVLAEQARRGSIVQQLDTAQELPDLATLVNSSPTLLDDESVTSLHYAFAAFLIDHYGIASLQQIVLQARGATNWQPLLTSATGQTIEQITPAWDQFLPRWFSGGWQVNAFNGFDTSAAQGLFDRGAYSSAIALAEQSQSLFTQIDDTVRLSEIEAFISLNAIGVRAEQLMKDVQASLEQHDYIQAEIKLEDAEEQYAYLPESHRPASLISTWNGTIETGLGAITDQANAQRLSSDWSQSREARDLAISAGNGYAAIGDEARAKESQQIVADLNLRLQRITLAAVAVVVLVSVWLLVWLWARAPQRFLWHDRRHLAISTGRSR